MNSIFFLNFGLCGLCLHKLKTVKNSIKKGMLCVCVCVCVCVSVSVSVCCHLTILAIEKGEEN